MNKEKSPLAHMLSLMGGHLYHIAGDMLAGSDGTARPTRFGIGFGGSVHVIVEIRPHDGQQSGWAPISDEEAKAPVSRSTERLPDGSLGARPEASTWANPANVWDHVTIYDAKDASRDSMSQPTALGPRGKVLYAGNRVGACSFFAEYCADEIARCATAQ